MLGQCLHVLGRIVAGEQRAVYCGMKRLNAPIEHFRETGYIADIVDLDARCTKRLSGAASRHEVPAQSGQPLGEIDDPGFVRNR